MTEQDIRDIAMDHGYTIINSPIWMQQSQMFIQALLEALEQERRNGTN